MKHHRLPTCGSTNDEARAAFVAGEAPPLLISSEEQTAGRGREGRTWHQLPGNFAGSFLVEASPTLRQEPGLVSLLSGLAIREALIATGANPSDLAVKWPNDVLRCERKVAGVLAELVENAARWAFIIGTGVNLRQAPAQTMFPAGGAFLGDAPDAETFGETLGISLLSWLVTVEQHGPTRVLDAFRQHAWRFGQPLAVRQGDATIEGVFGDIDRHGRMLLTLPDGGQRIISAGDTARA